MSFLSEHPVWLIPISFAIVAIVFFVRAIRKANRPVYAAPASAPEGSTPPNVGSTPPPPPDEPKKTIDPNVLIALISTIGLIISTSITAWATVHGAAIKQAPPSIETPAPWYFTVYVGNRFQTEPRSGLEMIVGNLSPSITAKTITVCFQTDLGGPHLGSSDNLIQMSVGSTWEFTNRGRRYLLKYDSAASDSSALFQFQLLP